MRSKMNAESLHYGLSSRQTKVGRCHGSLQSKEQDAGICSKTRQLTENKDGADNRRGSGEN